MTRESIPYIISILQDLLKLPLMLSLWSILVVILWTIEKKMCSAVIDSSILRTKCQLGSLLIVLFKFSLILLIFCLFTSSVISFIYLFIYCFILRLFKIIIIKLLKNLPHMFFISPFKMSLFISRTATSKVCFDIIKLHKLFG